MPRKHLVIVGAGHAHLTMITRCRDYIELGHRVTLVSASPYHYYSGMGPGLLAGTYQPQDVRFHVRKMAEDRGAEFIPEEVVRMNARERKLHLGSGRIIPYDVASFNTGSDIAIPPVEAFNRTVFPVKPIVSLLAARQALLERMQQGRTDILVIGGGPAGVEISGNVWRLARDSGGHANITLIPGKQLLYGFPERVRKMALDSLRRRGITVREGFYADKIEKDGVTLIGQERVRADIVLVATGIRVSTIFRDSGLPIGTDGGLLVNRFLQSVMYPEIFGGGDAITFEPRPLAKVGVYAVRENRVLYQNVLATLEGGELVPFEPQSTFMLIFNMGDSRAILTKGSMVRDGWFPWLLKDWIDRSFMRKFQVSGERDKPFPKEAEHERS